MRHIRKKQAAYEKKRNSIKVNQFQKNPKKVRYCPFVCKMISEQNQSSQFKNSKLECLFSFFSTAEKLSNRLVCKYWNEFVKSTLDQLRADSLRFFKKKNVFGGSMKENLMFSASEKKTLSRKVLLARSLNADNITGLRKKVSLAQLTKTRRIDFTKEN